MMCGQANAETAAWRDAEIPPILTDTAYGCNACFFAQLVGPKCDARQSRSQTVRMMWSGRDANADKQGLASAIPRRGRRRPGGRISPA
jgi:hypothetical protein